MSVLKDQSTPAPAGQVALRFLGQATRAGAVDLYLLPPGSSLTGIAPIATGVGFGGNTGYINAPSGTYSIVAFPARAVPDVSTPAYTGSQASYPGGSARTIVLIDQPQPDRAAAPRPADYHRRRLRPRQLAVCTTQARLEALPHISVYPLTVTSAAQAVLILRLLRHG